MDSPSDVEKISKNTSDFSYGPIVVYIILCFIGTLVNIIYAYIYSSTLPKISSILSNLCCCACCICLIYFICNTSMTLGWICVSCMALSTIIGVVLTIIGSSYAKYTDVSSLTSAATTTTTTTTTTAGNSTTSSA